MAGTQCCDYFEDKSNVPPSLRAQSDIETELIGKWIEAG